MPLTKNAAPKLLGGSRKAPRRRVRVVAAVPRKPTENPYTFGPATTERGETFRAVRILAVSSAKDLGDTQRIAYARLFLADAIKAFATALSAKHGIPFSYLTPVPAKLLTGKLNKESQALAAALAEQVSSIDPVAASFWLSATYTAILPDAMRSTLGIFYTPPALSERLIDMATEAGVNWHTCRVLDPACGGGAFLAPVAAKMVEKLAAEEPGAIIDSISARLRGFEIDPFAAWMSQVFLEITVQKVCNAAGRGLPQVVTVCDSLKQEPSSSFDLVIGNPPYGRVTLEPQLRQKYRRGLYGHANLYGVFTDLALRWTVPGGVVAYVTPTSFLAGEYFKALRSLLASEAPPAVIEFIAERRDVFENVLQETLLATYHKTGGSAKRTTQKASSIQLPEDPSSPWLLPRSSSDRPLVVQMLNMPTRLEDWGYTVSTGPLVWNRYKDQLRTRPAKGTIPLIWAEAIAGPGRFIFRADKRNHEPYFKLMEPDNWLKVDKPCVLLQRTTAKEQSRRLIAAALPEELITEHGAVVVENHLNMVRPINGKPKVSAAAVAAILNSEIVDRAFRCISGSVAVSAFELEALPMPSLDDMRDIEKLLKKNATSDAIEQRLQKIYQGAGA